MWTGRGDSTKEACKKIEREGVTGCFDKSRIVIRKGMKGFGRWREELIIDAAPYVCGRWRKRMSQKVLTELHLGMLAGKTGLRVVNGKSKKKGGSNPEGSANSSTRQ